MDRPLLGSSSLPGRAIGEVAAESCILLLGMYVEMFIFIILPAAAVGGFLYWVIQAIRRRGEGRHPSGSSF